MDWIACHIFPPPKPTGLKIFSYEVTWLDLTTVFYTALFGVAAALWFSNWVMFLATILLSVYAWMIMEWIL